MCSYLVQLIDKFGRKLARNQANRLSNSFAILKRLHDTTSNYTSNTKSQQWRSQALKTGTGEKDKRRRLKGIKGLEGKEGKREKGKEERKREKGDKKGD